MVNGELIDDVGLLIDAMDRYRVTDQQVIGYDPCGDAEVHRQSEMVKASLDVQSAIRNIMSRVHPSMPLDKIWDNPEDDVYGELLK